jgi:hypothetical protein
MIRNPAACCDSCAAHHLGDATDDGSFAAFLAANPDQAAALANYQDQNPGDPNIQAVYYNPVTKVYGPATLPAQSAGPAIPTGTSTTPAPIAAGISTPLLIGAAVCFGLLFITSQPARRR